MKEEGYESRVIDYTVIRLSRPIWRGKPQAQFRHRGFTGALISRSYEDAKDYKSTE